MKEKISFRKRRKLKSSVPSKLGHVKCDPFVFALAIILTTTTAEDFIPNGNPEFDDWQAKYIAKITANLVAWGIPTGVGTDWDDLLAEQLIWDDKWLHGKPDAIGGRTGEQTAGMQTERTVYEKMCRDFNQRYLAHSKKVTAADRVGLGTTVGDGTKTYHPVPDYGPEGDVKKVKPGVHELSLTDPEHPETNKLPLGADEIYVYRTITEQNAPEPDDDTFVHIDTVSEFKYVSHFEDEDRGKKAWYLARYKDAKKKLSPPGSKFSQTII